MKPTTFKHQNAVIAKDQLEYLPLPALIEPDGNVVTCWKLSFVERLAILFSGRVWIQTLTFNKPLQPLQASIKSPIRSFSAWGMLSLGHAQPGACSAWGMLSLEARLAVILMAPISMLFVHLFSRLLTYLHVWKWAQILLILIAFFAVPWFMARGYLWATKKK